MSDTSASNTSGLVHEATPEFLHEIAAMIVSSLNLEVTAESIEPNAPLYGEGLGLDSIDILEVALVISKQYGLQLRADSDDNTQIFRSLRSLAEHVAAFRKK
ncbi:MAG: putative Acyl carrier protein [Verrucomicrobiaceae bacterium]|nr:putative Acyl carrier protein [Verrucomicrobiaceae bacterium]